MENTKYLSLTLYNKILMQIYNLLALFHFRIILEGFFLYMPRDAFVPLNVFFLNLHMDLLVELSKKKNIELLGYK